jgi:hypothetical protein
LCSCASLTPRPERAASASTLIKLM